MSEELSYRIGTPEDFETIKNFEMSQDHYPNPSGEDLESSLTSGVTVMAFRGEEIVGFRYGEPLNKDYFMGHGFLVRDDLRSLGIGGKISELYFKTIKEKGYLKVFTFNSTEYLPYYEKAQAGGAVKYYLNEGYKIIDHTENTYCLLKEL